MCKFCPTDTMPVRSSRPVVRALHPTAKVVTIPGPVFGDSFMIWDDDLVARSPLSLCPRRAWYNTAEWIKINKPQFYRRHSKAARAG